MARRLVDSQFPQWADLAITPVEVGGVDNRTFRLGPRLTVRMPNGEWYALQVDKEQRWLPLLAPQLPVPIPTPVARGAPGEDYPYPWSVYCWIDGRCATEAAGRLPEFATALAVFLNALQRVDATDGPAPGRHNFYRGGRLSTYAEETFRAIDSLGGEISGDAVGRVWDDAMLTRWGREPVWVHGDVAAGNLLVHDRRLAAVIDFGCCGIGDPAGDLVIAWTLLSGPSRAAFRSTLSLDAGTWSRGRGWALWKALITLVGELERNDPMAAVTRRVVARIVADHAQET